MTILRLSAVTLFVSATLLFLIQPMTGRMLLPSLGGTAVVWNTALVFFQTMLLAGYLYAHLTIRWLGPGKQAILHVFLVAAAGVTLPIAFEASAGLDAANEPVLWLLKSLTLEVGLAFFVVAASAPMIQRWYASLDVPGADDPYFLYAASNAGSLVGLLAYPLIVEPRLTLDSQSLFWTIGYVALAALTASLAIVTYRGSTQTKTAATTRSAISLRRKLKWVGLAFLPSSLLVGATTQITTDIAAVPMLWVLPLALYIGSFVVVFSRRKPFETHRLLVPTTLAIMVLSVVVVSKAVTPSWLLISLHLACLALVCLLYHGALVDDRPVAEDLTGFYLWMSVGGVLGGAFNALLAPQIFSEYVEYSLVLAAALLWLPWKGLAKARRTRIHAAYLVGGIVAFALFAVLKPDVLESPYRWGPATLAFVFPVAILGFRPRVGLIVSSIVLVAGSSHLLDSSVLKTARSPYGVYQVTRIQSDAGAFHTLVHGKTTHGSQARTSSIEALPLSYFHPSSPLGQLMTRRHERRMADTVGVLGLGVGAMAAYARGGSTYEFFEIDPVVVEIASEPTLFSYLKQCGDACTVSVGDGRLLIGERPEKSYDIIVLDAYNSDSVPIHLLTREAVELYLSRLKSQGILVFNATNRHMDIPQVVVDLAADLELESRVQSHWPRERYLYDLQVNPSTYVVVARDADALEFLGDDPRWKRLPPSEDLRIWTDDYADLLRYYEWK